ncbi:MULTISPECIES: hypothetical protein [unclassified Nocardiopsis]|uniref:hypothetical protein n=1 Tax=unclassified Nocardiopsis TaxID=2649073 RepID=UPI00135BE183|nr:MULTISPECIES: hypothetical protein [unclassified Nocardiopsis]
MRKALALTVPLLVLALGACSALAGDEYAAEAAASPSPVSSPTVHRAPNADSVEAQDEPGRIPDNIKLACDLADGGGGIYLRWSALWELEVRDCEADHTGGGYTPLQREAAEAAGYDEVGDVVHLYAICGESLAEKAVRFEDQAAELRGALVLCPDHPDREEAESLLEAAQELVLITPGTFRVGEEIEPGTYVSESGSGPFSGCYWERTAASGDIIDNQFTSSALRVEVTVSASDYSFHSSGCGTWEKL